MLKPVHDRPHMTSWEKVGYREWLSYMSAWRLSPENYRVGALDEEQFEMLVVYGPKAALTFAHRLPNKLLRVDRLRLEYDMRGLSILAPGYDDAPPRHLQVFRLGNTK